MGIAARGTSFGISRSSNPADDHLLALELGRKALTEFPAAQALLMPGGLWHAMHAVPMLESEFGKPVLINILSTTRAALVQAGERIVKKADPKWGMVFRPLREAVVLATALCGGATAFAQAYPVKPVRMVVPLVPGGSTDALARVLAQKMSESLGQQIVVDNRGGASGNIGTELVARAAPDGYTIMAVSMTLVVNPFLFPKVGFDPVKDFAPISLVGAAPLVLVAHPSVPVKSVQELIALARKDPGKLNYPSAGKGTNSHLSMELFKSLARVNIVHVPYRGGGLAQTAILGGEVHVGFSNAISVVSHVKDPERCGRWEPRAPDAHRSCPMFRRSTRLAFPVTRLRRGMAWSRRRAHRRTSSAC